VCVCVWPNEGQPSAILVMRTYDAIYCFVFLEVRELRPAWLSYMYIYVKEMTINAAAEAAYSGHNSVTKALS